MLANITVEVEERWLTLVLVLTKATQATKATSLIKGPTPEKSDTPTTCSRFDLCNRKWCSTTLAIMTTTVAPHHTSATFGFRKLTRMWKYLLFNSLKKNGKKKLLKDILTFFSLKTEKASKWPKIISGQ